MMGVVTNMQHIFDEFRIEKNTQGMPCVHAEVGADISHVAPRGNASSCPLPGGDLVHQLRNADNLDYLGNMVSLPRTGADLANIVSMISKTASDSDDGYHSPAKVTHQATLRRAVVIK